MSQYEIRLNVEYVTVVEAESQAEAEELAKHIDVQDFASESWSPITAEKL